METEEHELKLNEDAVVEILCRLPKKSLTRFKCVSKQWLRLISDRSLVSPRSTAATDAGLVFQCFVPPQHRHPDIDRCCPLTFLLVDSEGRAPFARSTLPEEEEAWENSQLFGSCDGFLLFRKETGEPYEDDYVVCHPPTGRSWHLSPPCLGGHETVHVALVPVGGGRRHFKLVRYHAHSMMARSRVSFVVDVFSSQEEEWSRETWWSPPNNKIRDVYIHWSNPGTSSDITRRRVASVDLGKSVFLGGDLHWSWEGALYICQLEAGTIRRILFPSFPRVTPNHCIWESEGSLNYCYVYRDRILIWRLLKGDDVWEMKHEGILSLPPVGVSEPTCNLVLPFAFNDDFEIVYLLCGTRVFSYQLWTEETKEACASPFEGDAGLCIGFPFLHFGFLETTSATALWDTKVCGGRNGKILKT